MATVGITVQVEKIGMATSVLYARSKMIAKHREFSRNVVNAFVEDIEMTAPRDTGYMIKRMTTVRQIRSAGSVEGYGAGAYSLVGDPSESAKRGTISAFIKNYPKLRGARPTRASGAWWTLEEAGKERLRETRRFGAYGGPKPAYWYAIAAGLVPNAVGGTLVPDDFVTPAINSANSYRRVVAAWVFGGVFGGRVIEGGSWSFS